jgi:hypothetical protein
MANTEKPTPAELIDGVIRGGKVQYSGGHRQRNMRLSVPLDSMIANIAKDAGVSFQLILNLVVEAGLDSVRERLGEERFGRYERITKAQLEAAQEGETA